MNTPEFLSTNQNYDHQRNSSPEISNSALFYNDSGYITNMNAETSNSTERLLETIDERSTPKFRSQDCCLSLTNSVYFCEDAVFDEPKLEGPPLSGDNNSNYEEFSSLIKFSLENTSSSYLQSIDDEFSRTSHCGDKSFMTSSLSNYSDVDKHTIVTETVERSLTVPSQIFKSSTNSNSESNSNSNSRLIIVTPEKQPTTKPDSHLTPELFSEDDEDETFEEAPSVTDLLKKIPIIPHRRDDRLEKNERKLLKRVQENLSGVPPPPSVTILQWTVNDLLNKINENKNLFLNEQNLDNSDCKKKTDVKSLLIVHTEKDIEKKIWPETMNYGYHGLQYNRSKTSEDFEFYCTKYGTRYVGAETASSCTIWSTIGPNSATKRRNAKLRWGIKSPGKRLSHLARRRITFSSSNLQQINANMSVIGRASSARQLMINARNSVSLCKRKSPRKSPHKRIKTPSSSAKKRAIRLGLDEPGPSRASSTKRALFQSPDHNRSTFSTADQYPFCNKPRRALFVSPSKSSPSKSNCDSRKRKRGDDECHSNKFPRSLSSFDMQRSSSLNSATGGGSSASFQRTTSEIIVRPNATKSELSDLHRKKLLWAVSEALRNQQIGMSHPQFRTYAALLCKIVKYSMPDLLSNGPRQPGSTSDRMLRIAHQHCYAVTHGKTYDEIMQQIKETNENLRSLRPPSGYVAPPPKHNVLQDKIMNIELTNSSTKKLMKSPADLRTEQRNVDENNRLKSIRRQIVFDDSELTKSYNATR